MAVDNPENIGINYCVTFSVMRVNLNIQDQPLYWINFIICALPLGLGSSGLAWPGSITPGGIIACSISTP